MLTEIYIEALLVDEEMADQVWELWDAGLVSDILAAWAWWRIANPHEFESPLSLPSIQLQSSQRPTSIRTGFPNNP